MLEEGGREGRREGGALTAIVGTRLEMGFKPGTAWLYHTSQWHHEKYGEGGGGGKGGNGSSGKEEATVRRPVEGGAGGF